MYNVPQSYIVSLEALLQDEPGWELVTRRGEETRNQRHKKTSTLRPGWGIQQTTFPGISGWEEGGREDAVDCFMLDIGWDKLGLASRLGQLGCLGRISLPFSNNPLRTRR